MTNKKPGNGPLNPLVTVDKQFGREVIVGIVDSRRQIAHGFELEGDGVTPTRFRALKHGPFAVLIGAKEPCEIRILMDGKLIAEQRLDPQPSPNSFSDSDVVQQVERLVAKPQPFFITHGSNGAALMFTPPAHEAHEGECNHDHVLDQLHAGRNVMTLPVPVIKQGEPTGLVEAKIDLTAEQLGFPTLPAPPAVEENHGDTTSAKVAAAESDADVVDGDAIAHEPTEGERAAAAVVPVNLPVEKTQSGEAITIMDTPLPTNWAPSNGLIAIGVRMVQVQHEGEPTMPPDGFTYVLFQLNTWEDHTRLRANSMYRVKLPPKMPYREYPGLDGADTAHTHSPTGVCGCGVAHRFPKGAK